MPEDNVLDTLRDQGQSLAALIDELTPEQAAHRYTEGKWSVKEVIGHLVDSERVFAYRAMSIARGEQKPLPGYDQDAYMERAGFDGRPLETLTAEYRGLREATLHLFNSFSKEVVSRRGTANNQEITVRALAWIIAGHERHHLLILKERYGIG